MKTGTPTQLVAIVGGSGSGKTWLADRLHGLLGENIARLSLDDFYRDRSRVPPSHRDKINFDRPQAIDWPCVEEVLDACKAGRSARLPRYDFSSHVRVARRRRWQPRPLVLVDGLWLLSRPTVRRFFDLRIFIDCPERVRLRRRLGRDVAERGRSHASVRRQFLMTVAPMHARHVQPQARWADLVLKQPFRKRAVEKLADRLWSLLKASSRWPTPTRETFRAQVQALLKNHSPSHD